MRRRFLHHAFVGTFLFLGGSIPFDAYAVCNETSYIGGAGLKMRSKPSAESVALAVLKFNIAVCIYRSSGDWIEIALPGTENSKGWIQNRFLNAKAASLGELKSLLYSSQIQDRDGDAVVVLERILEGDFEISRSEKQKYLVQLENLYERVGDERKARLVDTLREKTPETGEPAPPAADESGFSTWFFQKFGDSSDYLNVSASDNISERDIKSIVEAYARSVNFVGPRTQSNSGNREPDEHLSTLIVRNILPTTLGKYASKKIDSRTRNLLYEPAVMWNLFRHYEAERNYPEEALNNLAFVDLFLTSTCPLNESAGYNFFEKLTSATIRQRLEKILFCSNLQTTDMIAKKNPSLISKSLILRNLSELSSGKMRILYSNLSIADRDDLALVEELVKHEADIYGFLPPNLKSREKFREYGLRTAVDCAELVEANPKDKVFFLRLIQNRKYFDATRCFAKADTTIRDDARIGMTAVAKDGEALKELSNRLQAREDIALSAVMQTASFDTNKFDQTQCPIRRGGIDYRLPFLLKVIKTHRGCISKLKPADFKDSAIYREVLSGPVAPSLFPMLPQDVLTDPVFGTSLSKKFVYPEEFKAITNAYNEDGLLRFAELGSLKLLSEFKIEHRNDETGTEEIWKPGLPPSPELSREFWLKLARIAKRKNERCEMWSEIEQFRAVLSSEDSKTLLAELQKIAGCKFKVAE